MPGDTIAVIHLVWIPFGIERFKPFIASYKQFHDETKHDLVIIFNGVNHDNDTLPYLEHLQKENIKAQYFNLQEGQDIEAYFHVAGKITHDYILFLNSYSEILSANWLSKYANVFTDIKVKLVSATGSWQSYYSSVFAKNTLWYETKKSFHFNFRKYKLFIKSIFYWRFLFKPFPNAHVRTNAFMIRRQDFLVTYPGIVDSKFKAYLFENGRKSLTNYYLVKGYKVLVVDKNGTAWAPGEWHKSSTFLINDQEHLLISDNQTTIYKEANIDERKLMTKLAWGRK